MKNLLFEIETNVIYAIFNIFKYTLYLLKILNFIIF